MKIRTQLIISIVLFVAALLIIAASVVITNQQVDRLNQQADIVKSIELGASELGYLSNDYILYHESQQLDRWNSKYAAFSDDLDRLSVDTPEQRALVDNIKANQQRLKDVFGDVASTIQSTNQSQSNEVDPANIQVSWSRLAVQTRGIIFDASRLSQMLHDEENQVKQTNNLLVFALAGAFVAFLLIDYLLIYGRAIKSVVKLQAGTKIIGSGNLDYQIKAKKGDEVGELADAFNQMTTRLKTVTASKTDLEREITERKQAEAAKEQLLVQLEARTSQLQNMNEELKVKSEELAAQAEEIECTNEELRTNNDELNRVTASLRETQDYLESLINFANAPIIVWDNQFTITRFNRAFERLSGYTADEIIGKHLSILFPDEQRMEALNKIRLTLAGEQWESVEIPIMHKDGDIRIALWNSANIYSDDKALLATIAQGQDITRRKQAEEERSTTVEFLRIVNESRGLADLVRDAATFFQRRSGCEAAGIRLREGSDYPYYEARGFSKEFLLAETKLCLRDDAGLPVCGHDGSPILECMCGNVIRGRFDPSKPFFTDRGSFWTNSTTQLLARTTEADRQARTRNRCNGEGYESVAVIAIRLGDECLGTLQLNDRRTGRFTPETIALWERLSDYLAVALAKFRVEEELRRSEASLAKSQEMAHIGSWELDLGTGDIIRSAESYRIFGVAPGKDTITYEKFLGFIVPEDRELVAKTIKSSAETGLPYDITYRIKRKDGDIRVLHSVGAMLKDASGRVVRMYGTNQDITERKQAEDELATAKAQADLYLDLLGHDISNMHQIIQGQLELAQEIIDMDGKLDVADKEMIDTSLATLLRSAKLIENVRNLQRLKANEYKIERLDLGNVLAEAVSGYSGLPDRHISISYTPVHGCFVSANPLLKDIFNNLLDNAVKHCHDPVNIKVAVDTVDHEKGRYFRVAVEDNGCGIPDDKKSVIFNRLKRGDTKARGTGLGLYIVRTLVEGFGGLVKVEDRVPGDHAKGARFVVCLPAEGEDENARK